MWFITQVLKAILHSQELPISEAFVEQKAQLESVLVPYTSQYPKGLEHHINKD